MATLSRAKLGLAGSVLVASSATLSGALTYLADHPHHTMEKEPVDSAVVHTGPGSLTGKSPVDGVAEVHFVSGKAIIAFCTSNIRAEVEIVPEGKHGPQLSDAKAVTPLPKGNLYCLKDYAFPAYSATGVRITEETPDTAGDSVVVGNSKGNPLQQSQQRATINYPKSTAEKIFDGDCGLLSAIRQGETRPKPARGRKLSGL